MAINLVYGVPPELLAQTALAAGQGQYAQRQEELARQDDRFNREEQLRRDLAALQDLQQRRQLGAQAYQFDATRADRALANEQNILAELQREAMRQQGFTDMREADAQMQAERLEVQDRQFRTREQNRIQEHYLNQEFNAGMASAQNILKELPHLNETQQQQAIQQWTDRFGASVGEFPFFSQDQGPEQEDMAAVEAKMQSIHGDAYSPNMARDYMELSPQERAKYDLDAAKLKADREKAEEDARAAYSQKQYEIHADAIKRQKELESTEAANQQALLIKLKEAQIKAVAKQLELATSVMKEAFTPVIEGKGENAKARQRTPAEFKKFVEDRISQTDDILNGIVGSMMADGSLSTTPQQPASQGQGQQTGQPQSQPSGPVRISSAEEYNALPSGAEYIDPNGVRRRKP